MKSATVQEPSPAPPTHRSVHETAAPTPTVYTRVRKPKRRNHHSSTRPSTHPVRNQDSKDKDKDRSTPPSDSTPPTPTSPRRHLRNAIFPTFLPPPPPTPGPAWSIDEVKALRQLVVQGESTAPPDIVKRSDADVFKDKTVEDVTSALERYKAPLDRSKLPFSPEYSLSTLLVALTSEVNHTENKKGEHDNLMNRWGKSKEDSAKLLKTCDRLRREQKFLADEVEKQRKKRLKLMEMRVERENLYERTKEHIEKAKAARLAQREKLEKAKASELDMRRKFDRKRLKLAALRGEMVAPAVDLLVKSSTSLDTTGEGTSTEGDALIAVRDGIPMNGLSIRRKAIETNGDYWGAMGVDAVGRSTEKTDAEELPEDAEETQLELLRNRLAMYQSEAREWKETLEAEKVTLRYVTRAKLRLEEELVRFKQPSSGKSGPGRGVGKGNSAARAAAKIRAAAMRALGAPGEGVVKKGIRKSRKGRPRRSLVA